MALQRSAGNAAVGALLGSPGGPTAFAQRLAEPGATACPPVPAAPTPADPHADPRFAGVTKAVAGSAAEVKKHPSGAVEAGKARDAALPPVDDKLGQAKASQADTMAAAKPKGFDKAGFIAAVKQAIAKAAPQNLDEADKFATSGKADGVKSEVMGKVTQGKEGSAKDVADKTAQSPDTTAAKEKPVTPLPPQPTVRPPSVDAAAGMPAKAPAEQTDLRGGPCEVRSTMADAGVTDKHLTQSNEPQLQDAAAAKKDAEAHAAQAPADVRQKEGQVLADAKAGASTEAKGALAAMAGAKNAAGGKVAAGQTSAKSAEETERARMTGDINKIFDRTKNEVQGILTGLDAKVSEAFTKGEAAARSEFTAKHKTDMERYKDLRYSGVSGAARWTADLFTGLPAEANQIFERAKVFYEQRMTTVISDVADLIGRELDTAKGKIAAGRAEIQAYVAKQPKNLQKLAGQAAGDINGKFDQLESDVDDKQNSLVEDLAQKYMEARTAVDEEIKAEQAKGEGLVDMAKNAVGESVRAILALKDMFLNLLSRAASAFTMILDAPVRFITNFMSAVKKGFLKFADNITTHLKKGLQSWLFGQLSASGIELPEKFDLMGVLKMIASMLGLTWTNIKQRIIAADPFVGKVIDQIESKIEIFTKLAKMGVAGVWEWIKDKVGDIKTMIFDQIKSFVIERVVKAGITWVLGMLNPAGALFKIVQALINVVQWIMERGAEMGEFIGTIIDAVMDIARGGGGGVPEKIEAALGKAVPLVLSFLASLLGLGGISTKVREFLTKAGEYVMKGVDWVVKKALTMAKPIIRALKAGAGWAMKKFEAGKKWVKGKYEAGKAYVKKKYEGAKARVKGKAGAAKDWVKDKAGKVKEIFSIKKRFTVEGEKHELYTATPGSPALTAASNNPTNLSSHPDDAVKSAYDAYADAVAKADVADDARKDGRRFEAKKAAAKHLDAILKALTAYFRKTKQDDDPHAGAPGLGNVARYSDQPSSLHRKDVPIWMMINEHVIPRAWIDRVFTFFRMRGLKGGSSDYRAQHTVKIYKGAAGGKTNPPGGDNFMTKFLENKVLPKYGSAMKNDKGEYTAGGLRAAWDAVFSHLIPDLTDNAARRTVEKVEEEGKQKEGGAKLSNKQRRAPKDQVEDLSFLKAKIRESVDKQVLDIEQQRAKRMT